MKHFFSLLLITNFLSLGAQPRDISAIELGDEAKLELYTGAQIVNTGKTDLSFEDFLNQQAVLKFTPLTRANENLEFTSDTYWVRFSLKNITSIYQTYYFETARPITDRVDLYQIDPDGNTQIFHSGDQIPFSERAFPHRSSIFKLQLAPNATYQFYLNLKSDGEVINLPLIIHSPDEFITTVYNQQIFYGLFYGIIIISSIIYLFFYLGIQKTSFLYYGIYVISIGLLQFTLDGFIFQYVFPEGGWFYSRTVLISALLTMFFLGRYSENFLNTSRHLVWLPRIFKVIYIFIGLMLLALLSSAKGLEISYPLANIAGLILLASIVTSVVALRIKGIAVDKYYIAGIAFLIMGLVIFITNNLSLIPNNFFTENGSKIGSGLEVIFLSISMTKLIGRLRTEKTQSQAIALRKSEELNDIKSYFMSNISHELRTPLNAIMGVADEMMKKKGLNDIVRSNFEVVKYASVSLLSSVNDILDFSKIEEGKLKLEFAPFNPVIALQHISNNWKVQASEKGLFYVFEADTNIPQNCNGDVARLVQIANNILANAIKFTPKGNVTFSVSFQKTSDTQIELVLSIKDTGVGISREKMDTIFESFTQETVNDKRNFGGLGLGLSIVKKLVDLHKGTIHLNSENRNGTECIISLPMKTLEVATAMPHQFDSETKDLEGASLLVVEDNMLNQLIMRKILSGWKNTTFSVVENGKEAIEALEKSHFDLILMDLQMPVMDGYETSEYIRAGKLGNEKTNIPIIAVTADTMEETKKKVISIGMNDYLSKPVNSDMLFEKVALWLSRTKSAS